MNVLRRQQNLQLFNLIFYEKIRKFSISSILNKRYTFPRYLGYHYDIIPGNVYEDRKNSYRENVLRPLEEIPSLKDRLSAQNAPDPILDQKINIGFTRNKKKEVTLRDRLQWHKSVSKNKAKTEGETITLDMSEVRKDWLESDGQDQLQNIADHYGIFKDLYDHGYFKPLVPLSVSYDYDAENVNPVYMGNILQASEASTIPNISYDSKPDDIWTIVMTNLDGHLLDTKSEYLHLFLGNIRGNDLKSAEVICDYLPPFPMRGSGYHRCVFVLYKQTDVINYSSLKKSVPCLSLEERTFKTFDFYKKHQDSLTPAGLAFFQCIWDESLTDFFHNVLNMQEPQFEYIEPPQYIKPQIHFPHLEPFNLYLDRYRDPKEIKKEILQKRLKNVHPFEEEAPMPKYPNLHKTVYHQKIYSWMKNDHRKERMRQGKYRDLRPHSVYPQEDNQFKYVDKA